jgi:O-antigen/teichoic acid export membrane protein
MNSSVSQIKFVVLSAWASRLISGSVMIYSLRVLSNFLTPDEYAMFIILVGLIGWFALSDIGIGFAVQNTITNNHTIGRGVDHKIICAYLMVLISSTCIFGVIFFLREILSEILFSKITLVTPEVTTTFLQSTLIFIAVAAATLPTKILYSKHRGYLANIASAFSAGAGLFLLMIGISSAENKVAFAVAALYGPAALIGCALGTSQIFNAFHSRSLMRISDAFILLKSAKGFFIFYLLAAAVLQVDYLIMSQRINVPAEFIQYYSLARIFALISFFNQAILFAAWPRMTVLFASGEHAKIRKMLNKLVIVSALFTLLGTFIIFIMRDFLSAVIAPSTSIEFRPWIIFGFGSVALLRCLTDPFAIFLQSIGRMQPLIICAAIQALLGAALQWNFSEIFGIGGILLALVVAFVATAAWALPLSVNKILSTPLSSPITAKRLNINLIERKYENY